MAHLRVRSTPALREPLLVAAFEGWNDAGDAATTAARFLRDRWDLEPFADIDPEEFYDFTSARPHVRLVDDGLDRAVDWPANEFAAGEIPGSDRDVIVLIGIEPHLKWRTFCDEVLEVARMHRAPMVVTLGALLAEVAHSWPVTVVGTAYDPEVIDRLDLQRSSYEGPTGILGALHVACRQAHMPSASLWATVPTYVPGATSPKAAMALVERTAALLDVPIVTTELEIASASYERQLNELIAADEDTADYVARLEARRASGEDTVADGDSLIDEVERFLRDQD